MPRPKYAGKRKYGASAFATQAAAKRYRARTKVASRAVAKKAWTRSTRPRARRVKRLRKAKASPISIALAAVAPVRWTDQKSFASNNNNVANAQNVRLTEQLNSYPDLATILGQHGLSTATGTAVIPNIGQKCYILSSKCEFRITNFDVNNMHFRIYCMSPKKGMITGTLTDPLNTWASWDDTTYDEGTTLLPTVGPGTYVTYGNLPEGNSMMRTYYRMKVVADFDCGTGATKTFHFSGNKKPFSYTMADLTGAAGVGSVKQTKWFIVIGYTTPMISATNGVVAVSSGKFGVMCKETYVSKMINYTPRLNIQTNNITAPTGALRFAADASDAIVVDAAA